LIATALLALTVGAMVKKSVKAPAPAFEEMRDAVAAPVTPALLGARVVETNAGYFASPAGRRAEAERALLSSRRARARSVSAQ